jgi:hypothetical protein
MRKNITELLSSIGTSDLPTRIEAKVSAGINPAEARELVALESLAETHSMLRALLLMQGRDTEQMSESEATHAQR